MKFAAIFALFATSATAKVTISVDDKLIMGIGEKWQQAAFKLQGTLQSLGEQEQKELMPYFDALQKDAMTIYNIDMQYGQKWAQAAEMQGKKAWGETYKAMGCTGPMDGPC